MTTETKTTYIAFDETRFDNQEECVRYEDALKKENNKASLFAKHFTKVTADVDDLKNYVVGESGFYAYSFVAFDGWEDVLRTDNVEVIDKYSYTNGVEIGKRYFGFYMDESYITIVDSTVLRESVLADIDRLEDRL